jgi:Alpha/beta hydrolase domain
MELRTAEPDGTQDSRAVARQSGGLRTVVFTLSLGASAIVCGVSHAQTATAPTLPAAGLTEVDVPGTTPMAAAAIDLSELGYTEREFYAEGEANRYRGALPGALETAEVIDGGWPYRTRVLVRAPEADEFNGTLVVEWTNVTAGQDIDFAFAEAYEYLTRKGYAVAVVSAQQVGVERAKAWSSERYGTLSVSVGNEDPENGSKIDDCPGVPACPGDALSWDIFTQVSKALEENAGDDPPLPGLDVERVIAMGESQSAMRLTVYYNAIQPIYGFFDGFVFFDLAGQLRPDLTTPAISVNSEVTAGMFPATTTSEHTRTWEVAGASHSSLYAAEYADAMVLRDESIPGPNGPLSFAQSLESQNCEFTPFFSTVDHGLVLNTAIEAVDEWIRTGEAAPPDRVFERDASGAVVRDADGNVEGGVRLAQFTAPTAFLARNGEAIFCVLAGHHRDLTDAELRERYGTHDEYVSLVRSTMTQATEDGYVLPFDRDAAISEAEASDVAADG